MVIEEGPHGLEGFQREGMFTWRTMHDEILSLPGLGVSGFSRNQESVYPLFRHSDVVQRRPQHQRTRSHSGCKISLISFRQNVRNPPVDPMVTSRTDIGVDIE